MKIYQVKYIDGRCYKIAIGDNENQLKRLTKAIRKVSPLVKEVNPVVNGIHSLKSFESIVNEHKETHPSLKDRF